MTRYSRQVIPDMGVAGVLEDPGSCHKLGTAAAVQLHGVAALDRHLQSMIAGNRHTTTHPLLTLGSLLSRRGSLRGRLPGGLAVILSQASSRLVCSWAPSRLRGKLATRAAYSASSLALLAVALASRMSRPWGRTDATACFVSETRKLVRYDKEGDIKEITNEAEKEGNVKKDNWLGQETGGSY